MMDEETWMTAKEAKELGFVDEVISGRAKIFDSLKNAAVLNMVRNYTNVPPEVLASSETEPEVLTESLPLGISDETGEDKARQEAEAERLCAYVKIFVKKE